MSINRVLSQIANLFSFDSVTNSMVVSGDLKPGVTGVNNLGSLTQRWANLYVNDLELSNGIGDYTIVEGEDDLFLYNNRRGKVYKFALIEVDPKDATPKGTK